jgi:UDP-glucose 4-epimerase
MIQNSCIRMQVGAVNLINEALKHNTTSFALASSAAVYGAAKGPWAESTNPEPMDPHGVHASVFNASG